MDELNAIAGPRCARKAGLARYVEAGAGQKNRKLDPTFAGPDFGYMFHEHNQLAACADLKERIVPKPDMWILRR